VVVATVPQKLKRIALLLFIMTQVWHSLFAQTGINLVLRSSLLKANAVLPEAISFLHA
jgi:hypothetical protein